MQNDVVTKLRSEFITAISSDRNDVVLDPSIGRLREKLSEPAFLGRFSIYSRGHLRKMDGLLSDISDALLKKDPLRVALAVDGVLKLFERLGVTVKQSAESDKRIEARRSPVD